MFTIGLLVICGIIYILYTLNNGKTTRMRRANIIGSTGEQEIGLILMSLGLNGRVFNNLYYTFNNSKTTEVDLVFLTDRKIYVIESKNYSGTIIGDINNRNWTTQYNNGKTYNMYNPIMQNNTHINAIKSLLGASDQVLESVIVFGDRANISQVVPSGICINTNQFGNYIRNSYNESQIRLTTQELEEASRRLASLTGVSQSKKQQHIRQVNNRRR